MARKRAGNAPVAGVVCNENERRATERKRERAVARVDNNGKARRAREQAMHMSLELFAVEKRDGQRTCSRNRKDAWWRGRESGRCTCKPE